MAEKKNKTKYYFILGTIVFLLLGWGGCKGCKFVAEGEYSGTVQRASDVKVDEEYRVEFLIDEEIRVFKNVDSWMYWKRNSANMQAKLNQYADKKTPVTITTWGWRNSWFSWFPNIVRVKAQDE